MLCERCKKNPATVHLTEVIKDIRSEIHICEDCAREIGLNSKLTGFSLSVSEMLSFLENGESGQINSGNQCIRCGTTFMDYRRDEHVGCPECYHYLGEQLKPILNCPEKKEYCGKTPLLYGVLVPAGPDEPTSPMGNEPDNKHNDETIETLRKRLNEALKDERYEDAAYFRDRIRFESTSGTDRS